MLDAPPHGRASSQHSSPYGVPSSVFGEILGREAWGHRPAVLGSGALTYGQLLAAVEDLSGALHQAGVRRGTAVGISLPVSSAYIVALLAVYRAGGVSVLLSSRMTADESAYVRQDSGLKFLIVEQSPAELAGAPERAWRDLCLAGPLPAGGEDQLADNDCLLIYTSGSTSRPKGVLLSDGAISNNVRAVADYLALAPQDRTIVFSPPAYSFCLSQVLTHLWAGSAVLPWPHGLMYPLEILRAIESHRLTGVAANPTSHRILNQARLPGASALDSVRYVVSVGQPLDSRLAGEVAGRFRLARILNGYGCTENAPRVSFYWLPPVLPPRDTPWPVGVPVQGTEIRIADEQDAEVPRGAVGNVLIRGTSLMRGYWRAPELTREKLAGGWFHTGDEGIVDAEGNLNVLGRVDNVFGVGHEKVAPEEVEEIIRMVEGVIDVGVAPASDALLDKVPVALLVLSGDPEKTLRRIRAECLRRLSWPKMPRRLVAVEALPRTPYGKLDRRALARAVQELEPATLATSRRQGR